MTTLVTGGTGLVGINVIERLLTDGADVVCFSSTPMPAAAKRALAALPGRLHVHTGDVTDASSWENVASGHLIDAIIHCAAITPNEAREKRDFRRIVEVNLLGTMHALEAASRWRVRRFVYCSSAAVYGANSYSDSELDETVCPQPLTLYAIMKQAGEGAVLRHGELFGLDVVVARLGAVFGRWEHDTGLRDLLSAPMQTTARAEEGRLAILPREGLRDWIYGPDVAEALAGLAVLPKPQWNVYNIGPGASWSILDWCELLRARFPEFHYRLANGDEMPSIEFHAPRDRAPLAISRIQKDLGFRARYDLRKAFDDYLAWRDSTRDDDGVCIPLAGRSS